MSTMTDTGGFHLKVYPCEYDVKSKEEGQESGEFTGRGACFHNIDAYGHIVASSCYTDARLKEFIDEGFIGGLNHDWDQPIGKVLEAKRDETGLIVRGSVEPTTHGKDVHMQLEKGIVKKLSIGFFMLGRQWLEDSDEVEAYWKEQKYVPNAQDIARSKYGALLITDAKTVEVSPTVLPANDQADIFGSKSVSDILMSPDTKFMKVMEFLDQVNLKSVNPALVRRIVEKLSALEQNDSSSEISALRAKTVRAMAEQSIVLHGSTQKNA